MKDNNFSVSFNFDDLHLMSVNSDDEVILQCQIDYQEDCIVYLSRNLFHKVIDAWCDGKQSYYNRTGGFAGVGNINFISLEEFPENKRNYILIFHDINNEDWEENPFHEKIVRTFRAFEFDIDMEHG